MGNYTCGKCSASFSTRDDLRRHIFNAHLYPEDKAYSQVEEIEKTVNNNLADIRENQETNTDFKVISQEAADEGLRTVTPTEEATKGNKQYYAYCRHSSHGLGWASNMYTTQRPAENAKRMHNKMHPGHNAVLLTKG